LLLGDTTNESNSLYRLGQKNKKINFVNSIPEKQLIHAHKQMLQFVIRNILNNATRFSSVGGTISVTSSEDESGITLAINNQGYSMQSEDNYHPTEDRIEPQYTTNVKSAGIALSISQDMISLMKGKLWATFLQNEGTTFYLKLPPA
jgi:signal transduction histidine kinase